MSTEKIRKALHASMARGKRSQETEYKFQKKPHSEVIETPYGPLALSLHTPNFITLATRNNYNGQEDATENITVNRVAYEGNVRFGFYGVRTRYTWKDGERHPERQRKNLGPGWDVEHYAGSGINENPDMRNVAMHRVDRKYGGRYDENDMTDNAKKKVQEELVPVVNAWALANPDRFVEARKRALNNALHEKQGQIVKINEALATAQAEFDALEAQLHEVQS